MSQSTYTVCVFCVCVWVRMCVKNNNDTENTTSLEQLKVRAWACMWMWGGSTTTTMCIPLEAIERCVQWSVWSKLSSTTAPTQKIPHHLYVSKYEYTNVCAWACMWVSEYVCVWRTKRRDWLYDAMERRLLALALGSGSWPLHPSEGLETNGAKLWGEDLSLGSSPSSPIPKHQWHSTSRDISSVVLTILERRVRDSSLVCANGVGGQRCVPLCIVNSSCTHI